MRYGAAESGGVLLVGTGDTVRNAVQLAVPDRATVRTAETADSATEALESGTFAGLVCDGSVADAMTVVAAHGDALPTLFVTDDQAAADEAIDAGATDVFVRRAGTETGPRLERRVENVLARSPTLGVNDDGIGALLESIYGVTTDTASSYEQKVDRLLRLGCETFGLSNGFLTRLEVDGDDGTQRIVRSHGPHELLAAGESCPLSRAYCRKTIETDGLLAVANAVEEGWEDDPAYEAFGLGCYIGGKVRVDGELYGTLCFASTEPRETVFTQLERTAVRLMSEWVSYELEQRQASSELDMKNRVMDEAPVGILISDPDRDDNPAVYVNNQFTEMTGYPEDEVLGRNCRFLQGEATRAEPVAELRAAVDEERPTSVELRNYRRDGTEFWNRVTVAPITDESGALTNYVGFQEDITERKEHELDLKLRNRAISAAPIGIAIHDGTAPPWSITYANSGFETVTGYDASTAVGADLSLLAGSETDPDTFSFVEEAFERRETVTEVVLLYHENGSPLWARVTIAPVTGRDGEVSYFVSFLQDVTETKEHAETIERRLDEFGDVLARELQTPLQEARARLSTDPEELSAADLAAAVEAVERLDKLIDDLTAVHSFSVKSRDVFDTESPDLGGES